MIYELDDDQSYAQESGDVKIRGYEILRQLLTEFSDSEESPMLKFHVMKTILDPDRNPPQRREYSDDGREIDEYHVLKMIIHKREVLGKDTFKSMAKIVQRYPRTDENLALHEDYNRNKSGKYGLPEYLWMHSYINKSDTRSWMKLYGIDVNSFYGWGDFEIRCEKVTSRHEYTQLQLTDPKLPKYCDLGEVYPPPEYYVDYFTRNNQNAEEF